MSQRRFSLLNTTDGILATNLLDKTADESITGNWQFVDELTIIDTGLTDFVRIAQDGTDLNHEYTNTVDVNHGVGTAVAITGEYVWQNADADVEMTLSLDTTAADRAVLTLKGGLNQLNFFETGRSADEGGWMLLNNNDDVGLWTTTDIAPNSAVENAWLAKRTTGTSIDYVEIPQNFRLTDPDNSGQRLVIDWTTNALDFNTVTATSVRYQDDGAMGGYFWQEGGSLTRFEISYADSIVKVRDGFGLRIQDAGDTKYAEIIHGGTNIDYNHVGTAAMSLKGLTSGQLNIFDSSGSDQIIIQHDGAWANFRNWDNNAAGGLVLTSGFSGSSPVPAFALHASITLADDATGTFTLKRNIGILFITSTTSRIDASIFCFNGTSTDTIYLGADCSIGASGSNPNVDGDSNYWISGTSTLSIKNRQGSQRIYAVYHMTG